MKSDTHEMPAQTVKTDTFLISVAPLTRIPLLRDQAFFYTTQSADPIPVGSLVEIPIGRRAARGIVTFIQTDFARANGITLKPITKVLQPSFLSCEQLSLAQFISTHYYCSLGIVLKHFIPERARARTRAETLPLTSMRAITLSPQLKKLTEGVTQTLSQSPGGTSLLLQTTLSHETKDALINVIEGSLLSHDHQILILVSEKTRISALQAILAESFPGSLMTTLSTTMTKGAFYESWELVRGKSQDSSITPPRIIIGTRGALFAPFIQLSLIIVMESHDDSYKQWDAHPRYDTRECARELSRIHNSCVLNISASPRVSDIAQHTETKTFFCLPQKPKPRTTIVDMKIEYNEVNEKRYTKSHPTLARALTKEIGLALKKNQQVLLFLNHQGKNAFSVCVQCKTVARCPQCERALVESNRGHHRCLHCSFVSAVFPKCSDCSSITFKTVGLGTETIEQDLHKLFPQARVARVDSEAMQKRTSYEKLYEKSISGEIDIIIGTQMSTKGWSLPKLALAGIIDMDSLLGGLDYDAHEKAYAHVLQLYSSLALSDSRSPQLFVQVYDTTHEIIRKLQLPNSQRSLQEFASDDLSMRQILSFPPYASLIKLTHQTTDKTSKDAVTNAVYEKCIKACVDHSSIKISEPHEPLVAKVRTKYRTQIVIKIKKSSLQEEATIPDSLHDFLLSLDRDWIIDRDPVHLS